MRAVTWLGMGPYRAWRNRLVLSGAIVAYWVVLVVALSNLLAELMTLRPLPGQEPFDFVRQTLVAYGRYCTT